MQALAHTDTRAGDPPWEDDQGWRVLDADGNVIASGPVTELEEIIFFGEGTDG